MSEIEILGSHRVHGGTLTYVRHASAATSTPMRFSIFVPEGEGPFPSLIWLSGLTCTEENFTAKAGAYRAASAHKMIIVAPDTSPRGEGVADEFEKAVKAAGGTIVGREFTNDKATDFMPILTTLKGKKPDVVFFGGMDAVAGPMLKQMKSLGVSAKFMGGDGICTAELSKLAGDAMADGQVVCAEAGGVEGAQKKAMDDFGVRYQKRFNDDVKLYAPYVYDAVNLMVDAMVKAKSSDPAKYLPVLAKTTGYKGVTGTISFDDKGDVKNGALTLYTYKGGKRDMLSVVR
jgi:branched-chain amino acid transport system substrate-binding protein